MNKNTYIDSEDHVILFLSQMNTLLKAKDCNFDILLHNKKKLVYTNAFCLLKLNYDTSDIISELQKLTLADYKENMIDVKQLSVNEFRVFEKHIKNQAVYIKVKIRNAETKKIFCISFHFSEYPIGIHPYPFVKP